MSRAPSDRNLLFGILALQMEFISQAGLIASLQAWTLQKSKPLGELLVELGQMSADDRAALEPMVDRHVARHGGSTEQSLAALSSVSSLAVELQAIADDDLQHTVTYLRPRHSRVTSDTLGISEEFSSASKRRFELLRAHAEGGLGKVWIAKDRELNREVAFKEIKPSRAEDSGSRGRFVLEAEITGGLEHPGIVPIYSLGHHDNGRPFYAMRFIRGDSLKEAVQQFHAGQKTHGPNHDVNAPTVIDQNVGRALLPDPQGASFPKDGQECPSYASGDAFASVEFRQLLGRFVDVCNAIEYAHSRGVLHRDLKPGNIMLGRYGETLVVDWGLAKATGKADQFADGDEATLMPSSGSGVEPTQIGSAIGTPAYMSPEQAAGRLDELGPATDVYSLGATLYHVLTGQAPFVGGNVVEILRRVQAGDFPRPRAVDRSPRDRKFDSRSESATLNIPKPLEAICLKAMSLRPSDRYSSPLTLAEDLERWLADEPVSAYREPLAVRARRFVRCHQVAVTSLAAAVVVALVGLGALSAVVSASNQRLNSANATITIRNDELRQTNEQLTAARTEADQKREEAEKNAGIAREQSQLALKSLESVIFDIQKKLENVPAAGDLRRALLQTALARLQEVSNKFATRGAIDRDTHVALIELGDVFLRIGTSERQTSDISKTSEVFSPGSLAAARKVYQRAFDIAQKLAAAAPTDAQAQRNLSRSYNRLGNVSLQAGKVTEALGHYQKDLEISLKLAAAAPTDAHAQRDLATSYERLGNMSLQAGQVTEARGYFQKDLEISLKLAAAAPADANAQRDLSLSYNSLGDVQLRTGQVTEARGSYQKGLEIRRKLAEADSSNAQFQRSLSISYNNLGDVQLQLGQVTEALGSYQNGLEIGQKLAEADPRDVQTQRELSISYTKLGDVQLQSKQLTEALGSYQKGLEIFLKLAAADPSDARAQRDLFISYIKLGDVQLQSKQLTEALGSYQKVLEISQQLVTVDPSDAQAQRDLSVSYIKLGDVQLQSRQVTEALVSYQKVLEISQELAAADPSDTQAHRDLSLSYERLGKVQLQSGQVTEALESFQKCLEIFKNLAADDPNDAQAQFDLYVSFAKMGEATRAAKQFEAAVGWYEKALDVLSQLDQAEGLTPSQKPQLAAIRGRIESCHFARTALGDWQSVLKQPAASLPAILERRGTTFVGEGRTADAIQAVAKMRELGTATADQLYNAACVYSLSAAAINPEKDELTAEQAAQRQQHIAEALATLREAIKAGYKNFAHMQKDADLKPLRGLPEFEALFPM